MIDKPGPEHANSITKMMKEKIDYAAVYLGASPMFVNWFDLWMTKGYMRVHLALTPSHLEIPEMSLKIPYKRILDVQILKNKEEITSQDFLWYGPLGVELKKRKQCWKLTYTDEDEIKQDMFFYIKKIHEAQSTMWDRVSTAKRAANRIR